MDKKLHNPLMKFILLASMALIIAALIAPFAIESAFANNHGDTKYNSWIQYRSVSYTDAREKLDATSSWDVCYSGPNHKVEVFATGWGWNPQYVGSHAYYYGPGSQGYLTNFVNENGYPRALLWLSESNHGGAITGVWSPDSI